jgi:hypothetical protein
MVLLGQEIYTAWLILPSAGHLPPAGWLMVAALSVTGGAVFFERYGAAARRLGRSAP